MLLQFTTLAIASITLSEHKDLIVTTPKTVRYAVFRCIKIDLSHTAEANMALLCLILFIFLHESFFRVKKESFFLRLDSLLFVLALVVCC